MPGRLGRTYETGNADCLRTRRSSCSRDWPALRSSLADWPVTSSVRFRWRTCSVMIFWKAMHSNANRPLPFASACVDGRVLAIERCLANLRTSATIGCLGGKGRKTVAKQRTLSMELSFYPMYRSSDWCLKRTADLIWTHLFAISEEKKTKNNNDMSPPCKAHPLGVWLCVIPFHEGSRTCKCHNTLDCLHIFLCWSTDTIESQR